MEGRPEGKLWEQARCEEEAAGPQLPGKSSWMIPGVSQTGNVVLEAAVARLCEEHSPTGGASSWKSTGTDRSQPSLLRDEPWHQVQTRIFPSPVSAAAQTADGDCSNTAQPLLPCYCHAVLIDHPRKHAGAGTPLCSQHGGDTTDRWVPPAPHSPTLRPLIPWRLQAQACGASAGDAEQMCRNISMHRIIRKQRLTAPPVPGGKTLGRSLKT